MRKNHIKEEVLEKTSKYMEYYHSLPPLEIMNAEVHMVLSEQVQLKIQNGDPLVDTGCWDKWTRKQTLLYRGFGEHEDMFLFDALEKNAKIVREILTTISSRNRSPGKNKDAAGGR